MVAIVFLVLYLAAIALLFVGFFTGRKADEEWRAKAQYYPVSLTKFLVLTVVSTGLYVVFWFYKNWKFIKERDDTKAWPFWRGVFSPFWYYPLGNNVNRNAAAPVYSNAVLWTLTVSYFVTNAAVNRLDLAETPWLSAIGFVLFFLFPALLVPLVLGINRLNGPDNVALKKNSRFGPVAILAIFIGGPLSLWSLGVDTNFIPNDRLYESDQHLWQKDIDIIKEKAFFDSTEELLFFYSTAVLSIQEDGNIMTNKKVVSYEEIVEGQSEDYYMYFELIDSIEVDYGTRLVQNSVVAVYDREGSGFYLFLPGKKNLAERFVSRLETETGLTATEAEFDLF